MGKISKQNASQVEALDGFEGHYEDIDGYTIGFETYSADADLAPMFVGLPNDHCQCPHWGVVVKGTLIYNYDDGSQDVIGAGEAYYARPGHTPQLTAGTEVIEFSPSAQLAETIEVVMANAAAGADA
jgi:hypothetical protein